MPLRTHMATRSPSKKYSYDVHPSLAIVQSVIAGLKQKTGRTIEEWIEHLNRGGPPTEKERREWLKAKHGLGTDYCWAIAEHSLGKGDDGDPQTHLRQED